MWIRGITCRQREKILMGKEKEVLVVESLKGVSEIISSLRKENARTKDVIPY
jgi:hypothetical protein